MTFLLDARLTADTHEIVDLPLCRALLMDDANFPWIVLVPRRTLPDGRALRELTDLDPDDAHRVIDEIRLAGRVLESACRPHKLNVAALGNQVSQLHVHVIARTTSDPAWPRPVWGAVERVRYGAAELAARIAELRGALERSMPS